MNTNKIIYWISTAIMCLIFLYSASMYLTKYEMVTGFFQALQFPTWLVYPLAITKILGVVAILTKQSKFLKELAYAGFFYDALLALTAHMMNGDGGYLFSVIALSATIISWIFDRRI